MSNLHWSLELAVNSADYLTQEKNVEHFIIKDGEYYQIISEEEIKTDYPFLDKKHLIYSSHEGYLD